MYFVVAWFRKIIDGIVTARNDKVPGSKMGKAMRRLQKLALGSLILFLCAGCGENGSENDVNVLIKQLLDSDICVRWEAARRLGRMADSSAVEPLINALKDEDSRVREEVAESLGKIGDSRAVQPLAAALEDEDSFVRKEVAESLGKIGDSRAVQPLVAALKDEDSHVRRQAAISLGKISSNEAVEPLIEALGDTDWHIQRETAAALANIGGNRTIELLTQALKDGKRDVSAWAALALYRLGDTEKKNFLITMLEDENSNVRDAAIKALGASIEVVRLIVEQDCKPVPAGADAGVFLEGLGLKVVGKDAKVFDATLRIEAKGRPMRAIYGAFPRYTGAVLSGEIRFETADATLYKGYFKGVKKTDSRISERIARRRYKTPEEAPFDYALMASDFVDKLADMIAELYGSEGLISSCVSAAVQRWGQSPPAVEKAAASGKIQVAIMKPLTSMNLQMKAAELLDKIVDKRAVVEPLITALKNEDTDVREEAARLLGEMGDKRAVVEPLIVALEDEYWMVREEAAKVLGDIGDKIAIKHLKEVAAKDRDANVRGAAKEAYEKILQK